MAQAELRRLLLVEDDYSLARGLIYALEREGFTLLHADCIKAVEKTLISDQYDLIILDINLPDGNGFDFCRQIKERYEELPIIFLTACDEEVNVVMGLDLGGDDYINKPFRINELVSRIKAVLRRSVSSKDDKEILYSGEIMLDKKMRKLKRKGKEIFLTLTEYRLIEILMNNAGAVISRERLIELLWDNDEHYVDSNTLSVYVRRIREKVENDPGNPEHLSTERGVGYQWQ